MKQVLRPFWRWRLRVVRRELSALKRWWPRARAEAGFYGWYIDDQFWHNWGRIHARITRIAQHLGLSEQMVKRLTNVEKHSSS